MLRRVALSPLAALAALLAAPHAASAALNYKECTDFRGVQCARLVVPLDRTGVDPGTVPLRIARIGRRSGPTLMYLSGGPGGAGVSEMLSVMDAFPSIVSRYRVIGYDQRGTGRSGLLRCPAIEKDPHLRSTTAAAQCAAKLGNARHHYTTADSVEDMEAIRLQLGVDKLTLYGISYGTELALAYARAHPDHVNRLILDSTVDADDTDPFGGSSFRAMAPTLRALCPDHCNGIATDPAADLAALVTQLRAKPLSAFAYDAQGRSHHVTIGPTTLLDLIFQADYDPAMRAAMPSAVVAARQGDGAALARLVRQGDIFDELGPPDEFSNARYATVCETTPLPWAPGTPIDQREAATQQRIAATPPGAFSPFDPESVVEDEIDLCLRWPDVPRAPSTTPLAPYPAVPTLFLQGGEDIRTPPEASARIAALIPGAKRLVVPGVGHGVSTADPSGCAERAVVRFAEAKSVAATCKRVQTRVPPVLSPPASITALKGVTGLPRKVGRTVRAALGTVADLGIALSPAVLANSGGGLRGGSWLYHNRRVTLDGYQAVTGVAVSGTIRNGTFRLRIAGAKAAPGTLTITPSGRLTGRLGGRKIALRLRRAASSSLVKVRAQLSRAR